ncbi:hypothetical protein [Rhodoblastus sp.]|uniref:hypothetical protein n=1 Tax=Rhodoblastus sp. TaxID=1962975 RepID=UPI0025FF8486|nr:hypothetical protein [Rhodoblastus sp.]
MSSRPLPDICRRLIAGKFNLPHFGKSDQHRSLAWAVDGCRASGRRRTDLQIQSWVRSGLPPGRSTLLVPCIALDCLHALFCRPGPTDPKKGIDRENGESRAMVEKILFLSGAFVVALAAVAPVARAGIAN